MKVGIPDFEGRANHVVFASWLALIEECLDYYHMSDEQGLSFANMKLILRAEDWWSHFEREIRMWELLTIGTGMM